MVVLRWQDHIVFNHPDAPGIAYCRGTSVRALSVLASLWLGLSDKEILCREPTLSLFHIIAVCSYFKEANLFDQLVSHSAPDRDVLLDAFRERGLLHVLTPFVSRLKC